MKLLFIFLVSSAMWASNHTTFKKILDSFSLSELKEDNLKILKLKTQLENLGNPIKLKVGAGNSLMGDYSGDYQEFEISYEIELSGKKSRYKTQLLPSLLKLSEYQIQREVNQIKFEVLKLLIQYTLAIEQVEHANERVIKLRKFNNFLNQNKDRSPQALANKSLIRLRIEEIEFEVFGLKKELELIEPIILATEVDLKEIIKETYSLQKTKSLYQKINKLPSRLSDYFDLKNKVNSSKKEIDESSWIPNVEVYAGQNNQDQFAAAEQIIQYIGVGISIPTDFSSRRLNQLRNAQISLEKNRQRHEEFLIKKNQIDLTINIQKIIHYLSKYNKANLKQKDIMLDEQFRHLSRGLISLQAYLDLDEAVHEKNHQVIEKKIDLLNLFFDLIESKKLSVDYLAELL